MKRSIAEGELRRQNCCEVIFIHLVQWMICGALFVLCPEFVNVVIANGYVATFAPDGTLVNWFDAQMLGDQLIDSVDVDNAGNIWVGRQDSIHRLSPNPNDKIVKFSRTGTPLLTIKGPMSQPHGVAFDSTGNVYATGAFDGTFIPAIFKYSATGTFITAFGMPSLSHPDDWRDINITSGGRLFVSGTSEGTIAEFTTSGSPVRSLGLGIFHGAQAFAFGSDGNSIFVLELANGPVADRIGRYNLSLQFISGFATDIVRPPWDNLQNGSVELLPNGDLVVGATTRGDFDIPVIHVLSSSGAVLQTLQFPAISAIVGGAKRDVLAFDMSPAGNYVFGFNTYGAVPEPSAFLSVCTLAAMGFLSARQRWSPFAP